jgi:hypothetical protein
MRSTGIALGGVALALVLFACAASSETDAGPAPATDPTPTNPLPTPDAGKPPADAGAVDATPATPKNECKLAEITGVTDVKPGFVVYASPSVVPKTMTGGTLKGTYKVDNAMVFLPSGSAGLVDPKASTGTINAWAVFDGTNYRLRLKAAFTISSILGPQTQGADTASQGGFKVNSSALLLDHACDTALADEADYSFSDTGNGRATILIKTPSPYGDTYLQLDAEKN